MVFPDAFPELLFSGGDVEDIIDHLKGEAEGLAEAGQVAKFFGRDTDRHGAEPKGGGDESARLGAVDFDQFFQRNSLLFRIEIENLSGDQAEATGGVGEFGNEIGGGVAAIGFGASDGGKGLGQQTVPREDSDRFPVDTVVGGATTTEVIIVHAGKIVVNQRVGVNTFDGTGGGEGIQLFSTDGSSSRQAEDGA